MTSRHMTDREDWTLLSECPYNGRPGPLLAEREDTPIDLQDPPDDCTHLLLEAEASNADIEPREAFPIETCPVCGAELTIISQSEASDVLR